MFFNFFHSGYLYGLEKFWAFLEYSGQKDTLEIDPVLKATLQRFKTVEDFRVCFSVDCDVNANSQNVTYFLLVKYLNYKILHLTRNVKNVLSIFMHFYRLIKME